MFQRLVIFNILALVSSHCFLKEDHGAFIQNVETLFENLDGEFFKNSNEVQNNVGYNYCKCKEESSDFLTKFCLSLLEGYYSRNRKMLRKIGGGAYKRGRDLLYMSITVIAKNVT